MMVVVRRVVVVMCALVALAAGVSLVAWLDSWGHFLPAGCLTGLLLSTGVARGLDRLISFLRVPELRGMADSADALVRLCGTRVPIYIVFAGLAVSSLLEWVYGQRTCVPGYVCGTAPLPWTWLPEDDVRVCVDDDDIACVPTITAILNIALQLWLRPLFLLYGAHAAAVIVVCVIVMTVEGVNEHRPRDFAVAHLITSVIFLLVCYPLPYLCRVHGAEWFGLGDTWHTSVLAFTFPLAWAYVALAGILRV